MRQQNVYQLLHQAVQRGKHRHTDDHTDQPEQIAAHNDGEQHPQRRNADGLPQNFGTDKVAVKLLDDQNQNDKDKRLHGVHQQQDKDAGYRADKGTKHRDNVRNTDKYADQHRVVQPQDVHCHKGDGTDNGRVDDLAHKEAGEVGVGVAADAQHVGSHLFGEKRVCQRAQLVQQVVAIRLHIGAGGNGGKDAHKVGRHIADGGKDLRHGIGRQLADFVDQRGGIAQGLEGLVQIDRVGFLNVQQSILGVGSIGREVIEQHHHAAYDLGDNHPRQQKQHQHCHSVGKQNCHPAEFFLVFEQLILKEIDHGVQHIGNDHAAGKGRQDIQKFAYTAHEIAEVVQKQIKCDAGKNQTHPIQHRVRFFLQKILAHAS